MLQGVTITLSDVNESSWIIIPILTNASNHAFLIHRRYQSWIVERAGCTFLHVNLKRILHTHETINRHWTANNNNIYGAVIITVIVRVYLMNMEQCKAAASHQTKQQMCCESVTMYNGLQSQLLVRITQLKSCQPSATCSTLLPSQHLRLPCLFSRRPHSLELSPGFHLGPDHQCRLFQTFA